MARYFFLPEVRYKPTPHYILIGVHLVVVSTLQGFLIANKGKPMAVVVITWYCSYGISVLQAIITATCVGREARCPLLRNMFLGGYLFVYLLVVIQERLVVPYYIKAGQAERVFILLIVFPLLRFLANQIFTSLVFPLMQTLRKSYGITFSRPHMAFLIVRLLTIFHQRLFLSNLNHLSAQIVSSVLLCGLAQIDRVSQPLRYYIIGYLRTFSRLKAVLYSKNRLYDTTLQQVYFLDLILEYAAIIFASVMYISTLSYVGVASLPIGVVFLSVFIQIFVCVTSDIFSSWAQVQLLGVGLLQSWSKLPKLKTYCIEASYVVAVLVALFSNSFYSILTAQKIT